MVRVLNEGRRVPLVDWQALRSAVEEALAYSEVLRGRMQAGYPLLAVHEGVADLQIQAEAALTGQQAALSQLAEAVSRQDSSAVAALLPSVEAAAGSLAEVVTRLRRLEQDLPHFSDVPLVNEILTLALNQLQGKADTCQELMNRLPGLRDFIAWLAQVHSGFVARHPQEPELAGSLAQATDSLRHAAGGLFLYLQEGRDPVDLSNALSLLDRAMNSLGACFLAMREVEYEILEFSENPHLDRLAKAIQALQEGCGTREALAGPLSRLVDFHANLAADLTVLEDRAFMSAALRQDYLPRMAELLHQMEAELALLHEPDREPRILDEAVQHFRELGERYDRLQADLEDQLGRRPDLSESSHYDELVALMQGTYEQSVPDAQLESKVVFLLGLQEALRRRLALEVHRQPEEGQRIQALLEALDAQHAGLETLLTYLARGQRELLLVAYDQLVPATLRLVQIKKESVSQEAEASSPPILCPFCGASNQPGSTRCCQCARALPALAMGAQHPAEVLDLYDSRTPGQQAPQGLSENFQFVLEVLDGAAAGVLPPEKARELLLPFWETVLAAEVRARDEVRPAVASAGDPLMASFQEELNALVSFLKETTTNLLQALEDGNIGGLSGLRVEVLEAAEGLQRYHAEVQEAGQKALSS